jgi:hypothetical protein
MHGGAKDFCENVRYNAIKRFSNEEFAILGNIIGENLKFESKKRMEI